MSSCCWRCPAAGCSRASCGAHGKIESKVATGSVFVERERGAGGGLRSSTSKFQSVERVLRARRTARRGPSSRRSSSGCPAGGSVVPSRSAGSRPSPTCCSGVPRRRHQERDDLRRRVAGEQLRAVDGVGADAGERPSGANSRVLMYVGVGPDAVLRVVGEVRAGGERVAEVGARRIGRLRDRDADEELGAGGGELRQDPAVGELVVQHDRVARRSAVWQVAAEARPERVVGDRAEQRASPVLL